MKSHKKDMISVMNSIIRSSNDELLFDGILKKHALKFKYFYHVLDNNIYKYIENIYAQNKKDKLIFYIIPIDISYLNDIVYSINSCRNTYHLSDFMDMDIREINSELQVAISLVDEIESEECLHDYQSD